MCVCVRERERARVPRNARALTVKEGAFSREVHASDLFSGNVYSTYGSCLLCVFVCDTPPWHAFAQTCKLLMFVRGCSRGVTRRIPKSCSSLAYCSRCLARQHHHCALKARSGHTMVRSYAATRAASFARLAAASPQIIEHSVAAARIRRLHPIFQALAA